jgi:VWFA-related protein
MRPNSALPLSDRRSFLFSVGLFSLGSATALPGRLAAQAVEKETTFSTDVKVINVFATVRDKQGKIVSTLAKDDFTLTEDGRNQQIRYFSRESDLPLTLGLLVDTSLSQRRVLAQEKAASFRFLDKVLRADKDRTFVIHFDRETELLQDLTSSRADLQRALDELELPADQRPQMSRRGGNSGGSGGSGGGGFPGGGGIGFPGGGIGFPGGGRRSGGMGRGGGGGRPAGGGRQGAGTTMYDAILLASDEIMKRQSGRKGLILLTDGVDQGSKTFLNDAIAAAQKTDTLVYSILFSDEQAYRQPMGGLGRGGNRGGGGDGRDGKKVLQQISRETGGSFFEVSKKLSLDEIFDRLQEELRNQYSLGYTPDNPASAAGYRTIKVAVKKPGLLVQSREGYYPAIR